MPVTEAPRVEHRYKPLGSARELFSARDPEVLLSGPAGTGKSRACLEKLHMMCLLNPGMRGVILRKTATSLTSTALVTFREHVAKEAIDSGEVRFFGGSSQEAAVYKYGSGSTITVGGMDKSIRIMSSEYDVAYVQEATELTEDDWEAITTRLRHGKVSFQQIIADCNPDVPYHWLKNRCDNGKTRIIYCRHEDNPTLYDAEKQIWTPGGTAYISKLEALTGVRYERLRLGKWAAADGLIYDTYDPRIHLWKQIKEPPAEWPRYWSIDFGFTNPFVCQFWALDPDDRLFMYREIYMTSTLVEDHAKAITKVRKGKTRMDPDPVMVVCDHDAEGRATLEEHLGITTVAAHKSVLEGLEAVKARLKVQADGRPRLYICRDALVQRDPHLEESKKPTCTQEEILNYAWGQVVTHDTMRVPREVPRKVDDHGMDAMRYLVAAIDLVGRPRIRILS
jgi:PBSX family phage terminase large subunit